MLTNIYIEVREQIKKPGIKITMVDKSDKTEVIISISENDIFKAIVYDRLKIEQEIIEALLQQLEGFMDIDHSMANSISFVV